MVLSNERIIKKLWPQVAAINDLEPAIKQLSDEALRAKTAEFKALVAARVSEATEGIEDKEELEKAQDGG